MTDTLDESVKTPDDYHVRIDPESGNKVITFDRNGETIEFIIGSTPEGTDIWQRVPYDADDYGPVEDFASDFDHADPSYNPNAPQVWKDLRESGCPVAHSDRYGGMWVPLTHDTVNEVAYDTENFTSRSVVVNVGRPGDRALPAPIGGAPPITSDPPFHNMARRLLLPPFAPKKIELWEDKVRAQCRKLLDEMGEITPGETVVDAAVQYAQHIPVNVIRQMLGFPEQDEALFRKFVHDTLERITEEPGSRLGGDDLGEYIVRQIEDHRANPRDDLTSYLMDVEIDGSKLTDDMVAGMTILLLIAGIDTTWSAIGSSLWHLAQNPQDHQRMLDDPDVIPFAIEEFLRYYAPVTMARIAETDIDYNGVHIHRGDKVLMNFPAACHDPEQFEHPDEFIIDRAQNRHIAFGSGIHRCAGSNLARLEMTVAIRTWLERIREFQGGAREPMKWAGGQVRGPRILPVSFPPGTPR